MISGRSSQPRIPLDPRAKLFLVVLLAIQITVLGSLFNLTACFILSISVALGTRISLISLLTQTRRVLWFVLFIVTTNAFTQDGRVILEIGGFIGTYEGLVIGAILSAKLILLFWIALLFAKTTPAESILEGIEVLLSPVRKSLGSLIMLVTITLNFIPSLIQLAQRIRLGYLARGIDIETGITRRLRYLSSAQVPLFRRAFRMSDQLALAMEARCYEPSNNRTMYSHLKFQTRDWIVMTGASALFVALAIFGS